MKNTNAIDLSFLNYGSQKGEFKATISYLKKIGFSWINTSRIND
jgi:hypothetical protein